MQKLLVNQPDSRDNETSRTGACNTPGGSDQLAEEDREDMADSHSTKSPAFQFYPNDFLSDANVIVMSLQERGAYITLICVCWQQGSLPTDTEHLARFCGLPSAAFRKLWPAILPCFRASSGGDRLVHPRLERERRKQRAYRKVQSDKGKLGGRPKKPELSTEKTTAFPQPAPAPENHKAGKSSSIFSLQSSSSDSSQESTPTRERPAPERVHAFIERYRDLHEQYIGVAYLGNPHADYQEACTLAATFDDALLEKLTVYWLNDRDKFATEGTRTIAKMRSRASKYVEELKARKLA